MPNTFKAKIIKVDIGFIVVIYITGRWRTIGTPFSPKAGRFMPHTNKTTVKDGAEKIATTLGIKLEWEG